MTIALDEDSRRRAIDGLKHYCNEELDLDDPIGDLAAGLLLDHVLATIGPAIYNGAIRDAQAWLGERVGELDEACWEPELDRKPR